MFKIQRENAHLFCPPDTHDPQSHLRAHWVVVIASHLQDSLVASPPEVAILLLNFRLQKRVKLFKEQTTILLEHSKHILMIILIEGALFNKKLCFLCGSRVYFEAR